MKPRRRTDLERWMREYRYSDPVFAARVSKELKSTFKRKGVTASAVVKWRLGTSIPRREAIIVIENITDGTVTAASFVHAERP